MGEEHKSQTQALGRQPAGLTFSFVTLARALDSQGLLDTGSADTSPSYTWSRVLLQP